MTIILDTQSVAQRTLLCFAYTQCFFFLSVLSPLLPSTPVMKMHTKTDFVGAVQELLGIVAAHVLTTILQVCVSPTFLPLFPIPPLAQLKVEDSYKNSKHRRSAALRGVKALNSLESLPFSMINIHL